MFFVLSKPKSEDEEVKKDVLRPKEEAEKVSEEEIVNLPRN